MPSYEGKTSLSIAASIQKILDLLADPILDEKLEMHRTLVKRMKQSYRYAVVELEKRGDTDLLVGLRLHKSKSAKSAKEL